MKPPWMRPENPKRPRRRTYVDNTGEQATYNVDKENKKLDKQYRIRD